MKSDGNYSRVLITTDVWARGIDVQQVSLVINYDLPAYVLFQITYVVRLKASRASETVKIIYIVLVVLDVLAEKVSPSMSVVIFQFLASLLTPSSISLSL
jgi:hypothetical protein